MCEGDFATEDMPCGDDARALRKGVYSAWLKKSKSDNAKARWLSSSTTRYFTIDFDSLCFYYSHSKDNKKISSPIRFEDILGAERLPPPARATKRSSKSSQSAGFLVRTTDRTFELHTSSNADAAQWVYALNAARSLGASKRAAAQQQQPAAAENASTASPASGSPTSNPAVEAEVEASPMAMPEFHKPQPAAQQRIPILEKALEPTVFAPTEPELAADDVEACLDEAGLRATAQDGQDPMMAPFEDLLQSLPAPPAAEAEVPWLAPSSPQKALRLALDTRPADVGFLGQEPEERAGLGAGSPVAAPAPKPASACTVPDVVAAPCAPSLATPALAAVAAASGETAVSEESNAPCDEAAAPETPSPRVDSARSGRSASSAGSAAYLPSAAAPRPSRRSAPAPPSALPAAAPAPLAPMQLPAAPAATPAAAPAPPAPMQLPAAPAAAPAPPAPMQLPAAPTPAPAPAPPAAAAAASALPCPAASGEAPLPEAVRAPAKPTSLPRTLPQATEAAAEAGDMLDEEMRPGECGDGLVDDEDSDWDDNVADNAAGGKLAEDAKAIASLAEVPAAGYSPDAEGCDWDDDVEKPVGKSGNDDVVAARADVPTAGQASDAQACEWDDDSAPTRGRGSASPTKVAEAASAGRGENAEASGWDSDDDANALKKSAKGRSSEADISVGAVGRSLAAETSGFDSDDEGGDGGKAARKAGGEVLEFDMGGGKPRKAIPKHLAQRLSQARPKSSKKDRSKTPGDVGATDAAGGPRRLARNAVLPALRGVRRSPPGALVAAASAEAAPEPAAAPDSPASASPADAEASAPMPPAASEDAACGAPARPVGGGFVVARAPPAAQEGPSLAGDLLEALGLDCAAPPSAPFRGSGSHGFVPNFHCTGCDMEVLRVENHVWGDEVAYMFLRNNYPNVMKLRQHLKPRQGCSAFCCQCSSRSADSAAALEDVADGLRWKVIG